MPHRLPIETKGALTPLLLLALRTANVGVLIKAPDNKCLYVHGLPEYFPQLEAEEITDETLFEEDWLPEMQALQKRVLESGEQESTTLSRTGNRQYYVCECAVQRYENTAGSHALVITLIDLTPERKREDTLKALLREVSHRTKNLLGIIQSIATQTALGSDDLDSFVSRFRERIVALAAAQDLVTDSNWRGAMFKELAARQFSRFVEEDDPRIEISGPDILLLPNGATHIALALHELTANAIGYGALSNSHGHIRLVSENTVDGSFEILWDEDPGDTSSAPDPPSEAPGKRNFGSTVLRRVVPAALEGEAEYSVEADHVRYCLRFMP
jgi:two-component sensor histidine kinase